MYGDSAYGTGSARAAYGDAGHDTVIKPKPLRPAVPGGFTLDDFTIDEQAGTVTCPGGHTRPMSPKRTVTFGELCADCPLRDRCTTATDGRSMSIHEHEHLLRAARAQARTPEFKPDYPTRSSVERIVAWVATQRGRRVKLRYRGVDQEPRLAAQPRRRDQPAHPHQRRPDPPRRRLGPGLTARATLDRDPARAQTGIGGKNDHVVDQSGLTHCRRNGLVGVLPAPTTLPCSEAS